MTLPRPPRLFKPLTLDQQQLLDFIKDNPQATVNDMCVKLGMAYSTLSTRLFELEDADLIRLIPGGRYALTL
ncbi:MAG: MarR family transcriptional regulator [Bacteroidales bacterium]|nr:MarR family transcriptional regulator [Bacteroidales bacterium]